MKQIMIALAALATLALAAAAASAESPPPDTSDKWDVICEAYGPGYRLVSGTQTCLRVSGALQFEATFSLRNAKPAPRTPNPK